MDKKQSHHAKVRAFLKSSLSLMALLLAAICMAACSGHGGGTGPAITEPLPNGGAIFDFSYVMRGNTLVITPKYQITYCLGDSLAFDSRIDKSLAFEFEVDGNTLRNPRTLDTLKSGAVVRYTQNYQRVGYGTGLQGIWVRAADSYRVISGFPDAAERMQQDSVIERSKTSLLYHENRITITETLYSEYSDFDFAAQYIDNWNGKFNPFVVPDSAKYDIALRIVDKYTVDLIGLNSNETVHFTFYPNYDHIYTSSDPAHAPLHYYGEPKTCPNSYEPAWYKGFLNENRKAAAPK